MASDTVQCWGSVGAPLTITQLGVFMADAPTPLDPDTSWPIGPGSLLLRSLPHSPYTVEHPKTPEGDPPPT